MNNWVLSIGAMVLLTSIITMLLPEGNLNKNIKIIFSLMIVLVMIKPILNLKNGEFSFDLSVNSQDVVFQENYLNFINAEKIKNKENLCLEILTELGVKNANVSIEYITNDLGQATIIIAKVDLKKAVFIFEEEHIDIIEEITIAISRFLGIERQQVMVYD